MKTGKRAGMQQQMTNHFPFGASFVPYAKSEDMPMSEWENDVRTMKNLGFNMFRSFAAWDRIERQEGVYDFAKLDYIFELAERYGMKVVLNAGGAFSNLCGIYPPRWIIRDYRCQHVTGAPGKLGEEPFGPRRFICMDDPVYLGKSEVFIAATVKRYQSAQALAAWSVWNEPILGYPCLCHYTLEKFRNWLKNKYQGNLELLNAAWGSEFPVDYLSWDEIEPGLEAGFGGGYLPALDWMTFNEEKITAHVKRVNDLIKSLDSQHPTTVNIITYADRNLNYSNNVNALGKTVDIIGYSHYLFSDKPYETAANLDFIRSASNDPARKFWIIETEAGPMRYYGDFYSGSGEGGRREKANWQAVGHGAKTILLWKYRGRISDKQTDEYNLMAWDGSITGRAKLAGITARALQKIAAGINSGTNVAEAAIFHSEATRKYVGLDDGSLEIRNRWLESRTGAYKALWDLNIPADFITEAQLSDGLLRNYKLLIIPFGAVITRDAAEQITEFVAAGGNVMADFYLGAQQENCRINYRAPGESLDKVFGGYYNDIVSASTAPAEKIIFAGSRNLPDLNPGEAFCELHNYPGADIIAQYRSGRTAIIRNQYGKGFAVICGASIFAGYAGGNNPGVRNFMQKLLETAGIKSEAEIDMPEGTVEQINNIEVCKLAGESKDTPVWLIINHNEQPMEFTLTFADKIPAQGFCEALSDRKTAAAGSHRLRLSMPAFATHVLVPQRNELRKDCADICFAEAETDMQL